MSQAQVIAAASVRGPSHEVSLARLMAALGLLVAVLLFISLVIGRGAITGGLGDLLSLWRRDPDTAWLILSQVRLPRTILANAASKLEKLSRSLAVTRCAGPGQPACMVSKIAFLRSCHAHTS